MHIKLKAFSSSVFLGTMTWLVAALFLLYVFFLKTFLGTLARQMIPDLNLNPETFSFLGVGYYLAYGLMQIPVGIFVDRYGVKKILTFAISVCALSSILFASVHQFYSAFLCRLLMGFGSSFALVCILVIALTGFPHRLFGFFSGISQFIGTMGSLLSGGPLILFIARFHINWRTAIFEIGILGIVLAVVALCMVREKSRIQGKKTLIMLKRPHSLQLTLKQLISNKQAWYIAVYSASIYLPMALLGALWGVNYLEARGLAQNTAANIISAGWLGYALGCPFWGAVSDLIRRRKFPLVLCGAVSLIITLCIVYVSLHSAWSYSVLFFTLGVSSSGQNIGFATISEHVSSKARTTALGLNNGLMILFAAGFPVISSYFIHRASVMRPETGLLDAGNYLTGFLVMPVLALAATITALFFIKETYCRSQKTTVILDRNSG
jgi:MFS family permease